MKKIYLFQIVSIFLSSSTFSQDTITAYLDKNWNVVSEMGKASYVRKKFRDSSNVWMAHVYYMNGNIYTINPYKSRRFNKLHGKITVYYKNGVKSIEEEYVNGLLTGKMSVWHETGEIKLIGFYEKGEKVGLWQGWYENGQKSYVENYVKGEGRGIWEYYYESGELEVKNTYINNFNYFSKGFYKNGVTKFSGKYEFEVKSGKWTYWDDKGNINSEGNFKDGLKDGKWTRYFVEEKLELNYKYGQLQDQQFGGMIHDN